jgi:hypothetical protein
MPRGELPPPGSKQCHPRVGNDRPEHGCIPLNILMKAAAHLKLKGNLSGANLRKKLEKELDIEPEHEYSFLMKLPGIDQTEKNQLKIQYLRPPMPNKWKDDPDMWLDSDNISQVMNQYEEVYPDFEFMGPFPIDFAAPNPYKGGGGSATGEKRECLMNEICELRVQKAREDGVKAIGIVYNLDPHFKSGSHWVANYVDLKNKRCLYFDSYGMEPPHQIAKFMKWLTTQDPEMTLTYNAKRLQYKNTECGIYCIYFLIRMLMGDELVQLTRRKPGDEQMLNFRKWLFST